MKSTKSSKKNLVTKSNSKPSKKVVAKKKKVTPLKKVKKIQARVAEAIQILSELGLPKGQINERTAYTILALFEMTLTSSWSNIKRPMRGVTEIMDYMEVKLKKSYAPNTRETIRRFSLHQLVQAGLVLLNPDKTNRAINSPNNKYQVSDKFLELAKTFGVKSWSKKVETYLTKHGTLADKIKEKREVPRFKVTLPDGVEVLLSQGGQNPLIKQIIDEFCSRYIKKPDILYIGDAHKKNAFLNSKALAKLNIKLDEHGKAPDLIILDQKRNWLLLIEAVTSHGPMNAKRKEELKIVFKQSKAPIIFVTAFENKQIFVKYARDIAWETEVWVADNPTHMIHYNGERFLGPYLS